MMSRTFLYFVAYFVLSKSHMDEPHPCPMVVVEQAVLPLEFTLSEVESLGEPEKENDENYAEPKHVASYHGINHCHERTSQTDRPVKQNTQ